MQHLILGGCVRVTSVFPGQVAGQDSALRQVCRDILHGVDSDVHIAVEKGGVDLLREETLATDICQGLIQNLVACRLEIGFVVTLVFGYVVSCEPIVR